MHKIPIRVEKVENFSCVEQIINAFSKWKNIDYQFMFLDEWNFYYSKENKLFSERLNFQSENKYDLLKKYHNIEVIAEAVKDKDAAFEFIKKSILDNKPVGIIVDNYWIPWNFSSYKKKSEFHYLLAIGTDEETDEIICVDSQMAIEGERLDKYHFSNGCIEYNRFILGDEFNKKELNDIMNEIRTILFINEDKKDMFNNIRQFAVDFFNDFDYDRDLEIYKNNPTISPFLNQISQIGNSRANYARALKYISDEYGFKKFNNSIDNLNLSCSKWKTIFAILIKSYYSDNIEAVKYKVFNNILEIATLEEEIYNEIKLILETGEEKYVKFERIAYPHYKGKFDNITYLDISTHFNNKGICFEDNIFKNAEISNPNRFIIIDKLYSSGVLQVENMKFKFEYIKKDADNVCCNGQEILVNQYGASYIMVLSCSEFANCCEVMTLVFENGDREDIELNSTSWMHKKPEFDEALALHGQGAVRIDDKINKYPFEVSMFAKCYQLKKQGVINKIILPVIPNIHIFAISMGQ